MRTYLLFVVLLAGLAAIAAEYATIKNLNEGESLKASVLTYADQVKKCYLVTPNNNTIEFKPNNESNEKYELLEDTQYLSQCQIKINNLDLNDSGVWTLYAVTSNEDVLSQSYDLTVKEPEPIKVEYLDERSVKTNKGAVHRFSIEDYSFVTSETCEIITPNGDQYDLKQDNIDGIALYTDTHFTCGVRITVTSEDHVGNWTLVANGTRYSDPIQRRLPIVIAVEEPAEAVPNLVKVAEGNNFHIALAKATKVPETCKLFRPQGDEYEVNGETSNTCSYDVNNVTTDDNGIWTIVYGDKIVYKAPVEVVVVGRSKSNGTEQFIWTKYTSVEQLVGPEDAIYCKVADPNGNIVVEDFGNCKIKIDRVSQVHEGTWKVAVGTHGSVLPSELEFTVAVVDPQPKPIVTTKVEEAKPSVTISCSVQSQFAIKACKFRDPTGRVLLAHEGVSESRYRYHGSTSSYKTTAQSHTCGLHITEPTDSDVGLWRCGVETEEQVHYGHLAVRAPWVVRDPEVYASIITEPTLSADRSSLSAMSGENVTLSCSIQAAIRYCYFSTVNHTFFQVSPDASNYVGAGFEAGECGIRMPLSSADSGEWGCHVGIDDVTVAEQNASINVNVTDPLTVNVLEKLGEVAIEAQVYQHRRIDYCVFVRIDGVGFSTDTTPEGYHAFLYPSEGRCELRIPYPTTLDRHPWTVMTRVQGLGEVSQVSDMTLRMPEVARFQFPTLWVILMVVGLSMILVGVLLAPARNRRWVASRASSIRSSFRSSFEKPKENKTAVAA